MNISSILKKLDISTFKILTLRLFGREGAVYDYLVEKANTAVNALLESHADQVLTIRMKAIRISGFVKKYVKYLPAAWMPYAEHLNDAFYSVIEASADNRITTEEGRKITDTFKIAFADYWAD